MFRATSRLLACRITFFTRTPCGLCDNAKAVVENVRAKRPLDYYEINVMEPGQEKWKNLYEFDTPVVSRPGTIPLIPLYTIRKCAEYLNVQLDPHRQGRSSGNDDFVAQAYASVQGGRSAQVDGPS